MKQNVELSDSLVSFLEAGVGIVAAATVAGAQPTMGRAAGCRVSKSHRSVSVLFDRNSCASLLKAVADTRTIAVVFAQPTTHRSVQLKGRVVGNVRALQLKSVGEVLARYADAWAEEVEQVGLSGDLARALIRCDPAEIVTVTFAPTTAFDQTPGPKAGGTLQP